jgi:putative acetyltransferase
VLSFHTVESEHDSLLPILRGMLREYEAELSVNLCFQKFEEEIATLPGKYAGPSGVLLLASWHGAIAGCGALRDLGEGICELKRIYVKPQYRGLSLGRKISEELLARACRLGYSLARLDTLSHLVAARSLYAGLGFREIESYNDRGGLDVVYYERRLPSD